MSHAVSLLACEDRLIRVLFDSACEYEIETCGIVSCLIQLGRLDDSRVGTSTASKTATIGRPGAKSALICYFCYGTLDGRLSLVKMDFSASPLKAQHCWEIHLPRSRAAVQCLAVDASLDGEQTVAAAVPAEAEADPRAEPGKQDSEPESDIAELLVGRADGTVELFSFAFALSDDGSEFVELTAQPKLRAEYKAGEGVVGLQVCLRGQLVIACTFTGMLFGLLRSEAVDTGAHETSYSLF